MATKKKPKKRLPKVKPVECYAEVNSRGNFTCYDTFIEKGLGLMEEQLPRGHRIIKVKITPIT